MVGESSCSIVGVSDGVNLPTLAHKSTSAHDIFFVRKRHAVTVAIGCTDQATGQFREYIHAGRIACIKRTVRDCRTLSLVKLPVTFQRSVCVQRARSVAGKQGNFSRRQLSAVDTHIIQVAFKSTTNRVITNLDVVRKHRVNRCTTRGNDPIGLAVDVNLCLADIGFACWKHNCHVVPLIISQIGGSSDKARIHRDHYRTRRMHADIPTTAINIIIPPVHDRTSSVSTNPTSTCSLGRAGDPLIVFNSTEMVSFQLHNVTTCGIGEPSRAGTGLIEYVEG